MRFLCICDSADLTNHKLYSMVVLTVEKNLIEVDPVQIKGQSVHSFYFPFPYTSGFQTCEKNANS